MSNLSPEVEQVLLRQLSELAETGGAFDGTTPAQTWAMHKLVQGGTHMKDLMDIELDEHFDRIITKMEQEARDQFADAISDLDDRGAIVHAAYDESHPAFIRLQLKQAMRETFNSMYPALKPTGVDDEGQKLYNLADVAETLGAREEELLDHAEEAGFADQLSTTPPKPLH